MKFEVGKLVNTANLDPARKRKSNFKPKSKLKYLSKIEVLFGTGTGSKTPGSVLWQYEMSV